MVTLMVLTMSIEATPMTTIVGNAAIGTGKRPSSSRNTTKTAPPPRISRARARWLPEKARYSEPNSEPTPIAAYSAP
jgi:hypothetical protein